MYSFAEVSILQICLIPALVSPFLLGPLIRSSFYSDLFEEQLYSGHDNIRQALNSKRPFSFANPLKSHPYKPLLFSQHITSDLNSEDNQGTERRAGFPPPPQSYLAMQGMNRKLSVCKTNHLPEALSQRLGVMRSARIPPPCRIVGAYSRGRVVGKLCYCFTIL